jgi:ATP-binding cassette subfamily B protein
VKEILNAAPDLKDGNFAGETETHGEIELRDVSFAYPGSDRLVLQHVSLKVSPGETVAIMGATGCGKTTLANLIPRFYDVTEGAVLVDGVDVRDYPQTALREKIATVLQKSELFSTTISENISWGQPGAGEDAIRSAAAAAQADGFISAQPDGYQTVVAERGMSLSGGQKQRLSIARAILKPAEIMIFDDSTSALDLKTEADLYAALEQTNPNSTKIIIAQRIASVRRADRIAVIENGTIAACGSHEQLLETSELYRDIYYSQVGEGDDTDE